MSAEGKRALVTGSSPRLAKGIALSESKQHPILFRCLLDEQPTEFFPKRLLAKLKEAGRSSRLILNPGCWFSRDGLVRAPFLDNFSRAPGLVWILDPATDALLPFWLGPAFLERLGDLQPGNPAPPALPRPVLSVLRCAQVLVSEDHKAERRRQWAETVAKCKAAFQQRGYVSLQGLLHPFHVAALRRYYRDLIAAGRFQLGDAQCADRYACHNESVARFFHHQLTTAISEVAGEPVQPSYVYVARYCNGAQLEKHVDREQCEFSVSLCLDFTPEPSGRSPWPLYLETQQGAVAIRQHIGEGLLYRGRQLPHHRRRLAKGCTSTSVFFHYVRRDFAGPLE